METEHLSSFELEAVQAGAASERAAAHARDCEACSRKLATQREEHSQVAQSVGYARTLKRLEALADEPARPRWRWLWAALPALAVVMVLIFFVATPSEAPDIQHLKGVARVRLMRADGDEAKRGRPGESLSLSLGAGGHAFAVVFAVDADGQVRQLWPDSPGSASAPRQALAVIGSPLTVTTGNVQVVALLSDTALTGAEARATLDRHLGGERMNTVEIVSTTLEVDR